MTTGSLTKTPTTETQVAIKFSEIEIPDSLNARSDLPDIEELAASLKDRGQLTPIVVTNGGQGKKPYTLICGARRMAAFKLLGWTSREVLAVVREYAADDLLGPVMDNWIENEEREGFSTLDKAERIAQFLAGTYFVPAGLTAVPLSADVVAAKCNKTKRTVQKLAKVHRDVDPDVAVKCRKVDAPEWFIIALSQIEGTGATKEAKEESRAKLQMAKLTEWQEAKLELEKTGRQRAPKKDKKKGKKKAAPQKENEWGAIDASQPLDRRERTAEDYFAILGKKAAAKSTSKDDALLVEGALTMMKLLSGERKSLGFVTEADWKELMPAPEEPEGDEEDDDSEVEET